MRKITAILLVLVMIFTLCSCGKDDDTQAERECGVFVALENDSVYTISCGSESGSESYANEDGSVLPVGSVAHFDFAGELAEQSSRALIEYTVCVYDKDLNILASETFTDNFADMARIDITITEDLHIIHSGDALLCGGDMTVDFVSSVDGDTSILVPTVTMPNDAETAQAINDSISSVNTKFTENHDAYKDTFTTNTEDEKKPPEFSMSRVCTVSRGDDSVLSIRFSDTVATGVDSSDIYVFGLNFDLETGKEISLADITDDLDALTDFCKEAVLIATTEEYDFIADGMTFNEGYTDTLASLISDGNWYFSLDGIVFVANPGVIADKSAGKFEFTVPYSDLEDYIDEYYIWSGEGGDSELSVADADADVTMINESTVENAPIISVKGNVYDLGVYAVSFNEEDSSFTVGNELWFCSYISEGGAFAVNAEISTDIPDIVICYLDASGTYQRRLVSIQDGNVLLTDPNGGEEGTVISDALPYDADLNGDGKEEAIDIIGSSDSGTISVSIGDATAETIIKQDMALRLYDIDKDGNDELFVDGNIGNDEYATYCFKYDDGKITAFTFSDSDYSDGIVYEFKSGKLVMLKMVDVLGSYTGECTYNLEDGEFTLSDTELVFIKDNETYLTTSKDIELSDGSTLSSGTKILVTSTDLSSIINFITEDGTTGTIKAAKSGSSWKIDGKSDSSFFSTELPYAS